MLKSNIAGKCGSEPAFGIPACQTSPSATSCRGAYLASTASVTASGPSAPCSSISAWSGLHACHDHQSQVRKEFQIRANHGIFKQKRRLRSTHILYSVIATIRARWQCLPALNSASQDGTFPMIAHIPGCPRNSHTIPLTSRGKNHQWTTSEHIMRLAAIQARTCRLYRLQWCHPPVQEFSAMRAAAWIR
jgi:hypothetical protein